jgi:DNA repair protein RadC
MLLAYALDGRMAIKAILVVAKGGASAAVITPRDLFLPLVRLGATSFVLVHNHPSGDPKPSHADVVLTNVAMKIGAHLGIPLVDHIVVAAEGTFSFEEHGLLLTDDEMTKMLHEDAGLSGGAS